MATEGEAWTRAQLHELMAARFRPSAVAAFLVASQRRAGMVRRARPEVVRREMLFAAAGAAAWGALAAGRIEPFRRRLRSGLGGWAITVVMLDWHLGMLETAEGRPRNLGVADAATLVRAWLVPAVADRASPWLCTVGFASDALDGRLARATRPTRLGRDLEGAVDAAFAVAALRGALRHGRLGRAAVAAEAVRLSVGVGYAAATYFVRAEPPDPRLLRAGRALAPLRAAGLVVAGAGHRAAGEALLTAGSVTSAAVVVRAGAASARRRRRAPPPDGAVTAQASAAPRPPMGPVGGRSAA